MGHQPAMHWDITITKIHSAVKKRFWIFPARLHVTGSALARNLFYGSFEFHFEYVGRPSEPHDKLISFLKEQARAEFFIREAAPQETLESFVGQYYNWRINSPIKS